MSTIHTFLFEATETLANAQISSPRIDAEWLLADVLQCTRSDLHLNPHQTLSAKQHKHFCDLIDRRAQRIPLQHLVGKTEFYGLPFFASPNALIPRPETETLIETVLKRAPNHAQILDIGTGSGIIAITLAHELPNARVIATDISCKSLRLARQNAHLNHVAHKISFLQADLLSAIATPFNIIVSNPPYIATKDIDTLEPEVCTHDPIQALDGGTDGLDFYRKIIPASTSLLWPDGLLALEIGHNQIAAVLHLLDRQPTLGAIGSQADLSGHPRVVFAHRL